MTRPNYKYFLKKQHSFCIKQKQFKNWLFKHLVYFYHLHKKVFSVLCTQHNQKDNLTLHVLLSTYWQQVRPSLELNPQLGWREVKSSSMWNDAFILQTEKNSSLFLPHWYFMVRSARLTTVTASVWIRLHHLLQASFTAVPSYCFFSFFFFFHQQPLVLSMWPFLQRLHPWLHFFELWPHTAGHSAAI